MWLGMILFWGLLIWAIYALVTSLTRNRAEKDGTTDEARQILDRRLARGEIDESEYGRLRELIGSGGGKSGAGPGSSR
jgi:uncharacterized membrane protein